MRIRRGGNRFGVTILVRGGIYRLNETFILGAQDSGTDSNPMVFRAYPNEQPVLAGAKLVTNFRPFRDHIVCADLKGYALPASGIRQLFVDGKRQILARFPNRRLGDPIENGFLYAEGVAEEGSKVKLKYREGAARDWAEPNNAEIVIFSGPNYWNDTVPIKEIDHVTRTITLAGNVSYAIQQGNRYFFQNILEELDSPGEWYFDVRKRMLYYWPENEEASPPSVSVPILRSIVEIEGKAYSEKYKAVPTNIRFEGFTLEDCEGTAILLRNAKNVLIGRNTIRNAGENGIEVSGGCGNTLIGNDVYEVGASGITVTGGDRKTLSPGIHRVENNYVHHVGVFKKASSAIACWGVGNIVSHNLIHSTPRIGIWFDGNDHAIEYNHVHHVNQETQDSGVIAGCARDWTKRGNVVRFNYVHHSGGYGRNTSSEPWQSPFSTWGIYLDDWLSGTTVYGNIVANTCTGGVLIHGGRDNIVENNVVAEGGTAQMVYSAILPTAKELPQMFTIIKKMGYTKYPLLSTINDAVQGTNMSGNKFLHNIIYYTNSSSVLYGIYGSLDLATTASDYNVIYHAGLPLRITGMNSPEQFRWIKWKDGGLDRNSVVSDPLFDQSKPGTFQLLPASPALKMGFQPIPFDKIGPYEDAMRASWPIRESNQ